MNNLKKIMLTTTKKGIPCIWEEGGASATGGSARLIGDLSGQMKQALFLKTKGKLSCDQHALVRVEESDVIVDVQRVNQELLIQVYRVKSIIDDVAEETADGVKINNNVTQLAQAVAEKVAKYRNQKIVEGSISYKDNGPTIKVTYQYEQKICVLETIGVYRHDAWSVVPNDVYSTIIDKAIEKANTYHCREALYATPPTKYVRGESFD